MSKPTDPDLNERAPNGWPVTQLRGFRAGDRVALAAVYREHVGALLVFLQRGFSFDSRGRALRFAGFRSSFELHDAVQETFRRAFEHEARQSYDGLRPFGAWLNVIGRNVVLKEFRRNERLFLDAEPVQGGESMLASLASESEAPEIDLHRARIRSLVRSFLGTLSAEERELLHMRFVEEVGQRDAADRLEMGRQRLRGQEAKLRERLIRFLLQHEQGPGRSQLRGAGTLLVLAGSSQLNAWFDAAWYEACALCSPSPALRGSR